MTTPTAIVVSTQNCCGNSWTSFSEPASNVHDPGGKNSSWNSANAWSNRSTPPIPPTTVTTAITSPLVDRRRHRTPRARSERENANDPAIRSADPAAMRKKRWNTIATSTMCCRSRASSTGTPSSVTSNAAGPMTRSARISFVTSRSCSVV